MICASTIIILTATTIVLGWLAYHQKQAMNAQKSALQATMATVEALKTQSDLRAEPLKETINSKEAAIRALEAQLEAAAERKALAEEKLRENQEQLNRLTAELPSELGRRIQAAVDKERASLLRTAGIEFFNFGYYIGVMNVGGLVLQIQSLAYARLDKENLTPMEYALRAGADYFRNSVLFLYRERRVALERCMTRLRSPGIEIPASMLEQVDQLAATDRMARDSGLLMDPEVDALSSMPNVPFDPALFNIPS